MITEKLMEKPWIIWRLWNAFVSNGLSMGGAVTDTAVGDVMFEDIIYDDLVTAHGNDVLIPGKKYRITDYKTVFTLNISGDPYTSATVEPLIVTAATNNTLEPTAFSVAHPNDIIYYSLDGTTYMPGSTKGCIYRRIDTEKNISVPFDFREFRVEVAAPEEGTLCVADPVIRGDISYNGSWWQLAKIPNSDNCGDTEFYANIGDQTSLKMLKGFTFFNRAFTTDVSLASTPSLCFNISNSYNFVINKQPSTISESLFLTYGYVKNCTFDALDNCHFNTEDDIINCHGGVIKDYILTSGSFTNNNLAGVEGLITGTFNNNTVAKGFNNNFIATASGNTIAADATGNIIGSDFRDNTIGLRFQNNTIGTNFGGQADNYGDQIGNDFHDNVIGNYFSGNVIGHWFYSNTVGNDCQENNLPYKFYSNTTGDSFQNWNGHHYLNGVDFTAILTLPVSGATKYIFYDPTDFNSWGYYDNGVFILTPF